MKRLSVKSLYTLQVAAVLLIAVLVVGVLSWAKVVLIPIALAILITFILTPVVRYLDHRGVGRVLAVVGVVGVAGLIGAGLLWLVASQLHSLADDLPRYKDNLRAKWAVLQQGGEGGVVQKVRSVFREVASGEQDKPGEAGPNAADPQTPPKPVPVQITPQLSPEEKMTAFLASLLALSPALGSLATGGLALVLVVFMLIKREDLRNRLVSMTAKRSLATTTMALDDAGQRISRYLVMQLIINGSFGLAVGIGLLLIGVPYALLWGLCAALFRYIPYIGPWIAAVLPLLVSVITSTGWTQVLLVLGLFLVLELVSNNVMEPWLYGQGVGISEVALLISATFWAWIWGPVGLILATPLTVCLVVTGKYVPALSFLDRLLGDRPALEPSAVFLQRLLARDEREARDIVERYRTEHAPETVYDEVLVEALAMARKERVQGVLRADQEGFILKATRSILESLREKMAAPLAAPDQPAARVSRSEDDGALRVDGGHETGGGASEPAPEPEPVKILGCVAHQAAEELTLEMLAQLLAPKGVQFDSLSTRSLPGEVVEQVARRQVSVVVIAVLPPGGLIQARYLCRVLRKAHPDLRILVGCWGYEGDLDRTIVKLRSAGAQYVTTTLLGALNHVTALAPPRPQGDPAARSRDSGVPEPIAAGGRSER